MAAKWKVRLTYKMLKEGKSNKEINDALLKKTIPTPLRDKCRD